MIRGGSRVSVRSQIIFCNFEDSFRFMKNKFTVRDNNNFRKLSYHCLSCRLLLVLQKEPTKLKKQRKKFKLINKSIKIMFVY